MRQRSDRIFYGWIIAVASAVGVGFSVSVYVPATIGILLAPLHEAFGWSAPAIYLAISFATGATILVAPWVGNMIDHFGARRVIVASFAAQAIIVASFGYLTSDIGWFYARYAALAVFATGTTAVAFSALISRWFDRRRGLALGIALGGLGIGGVVWSLLTQWLIDQHGWRQAFFYLGGVIAFVVIPAMMACLRETPQSMGLNVDGEISAVGGELQPRPVAFGLTLRQAVAGAQYWAIAVAFLLIATAAYGVMLHLVPLLRKQGASSQAAAAAQAWLWAVLVAGRVLTGWLMDRFFAPRVAFAFLLPPIVGTVMLAMGVNGPAAIVAVMLVGLAAGAEVDVLAYLSSRYFGLAHLGTIYATYFSIYAIGTSTGPFVVAWLVARNGGYSSALWCLVAALGVAALLLLSFRPFPKLQPSETLSHA
jgi:OFA family oxalate/formate antiporter-like MFS transporter